MHQICILNHLRGEIDALNDVIFHDVNNGVYKCGFARSQEAYEQAYDTLFARLDELEERLIETTFLIWGLHYRFGCTPLC